MNQTPNMTTNRRIITSTDEQEDQAPLTGTLSTGDHTGKMSSHKVCL